MVASISHRVIGQIYNESASVKWLYDLARNKVGDEGCMWLSRANWPNFICLLIGSIYAIIGSNEIGNEGCSHLSRSQWP